MESRGSVANEAAECPIEELAGWAQAFSPIVHIEDPDALLLDVTGCERLFGGEQNLLRRALQGLAEQIVAARTEIRGSGSVRGAIADTPGAAWALAHAHGEPEVVTQPGRDVEDLLCLPVGALRIDEATVATLRAVGVETIETLMYLPRASLGSRFGPTLLCRLDQALGNVAEPLVPYHPPTVLSAHQRLGAATDRRDIIDKAAAHALSRFCGQLTERVAGVLRVQVTFHCPAAAAQTFTIELSQPTRSLKHLQSLLATRLDQVRLPAKTDAVMIWTRHTEPLDDRQGELFATAESDADGLSALIDRLATRLGSPSVLRAALLDEYQPERAYQCIPAVGAAHGDSGRDAQQTARRKCSPKGEHATRPLRLLAEPAEIAVVSAVPEGPPTMFRFQSAEHPIVACAGSERLETGWWRGPHVQRDYFRVLSASGQSFWIFRSRETGKWFLHGMFD